MSVPHHVAIVMDGNGRWATQRMLPRAAGHQQGMKSLQRCVKACMERGIAVLTVFAFSSENWNRPKEEVSGLMQLALNALSKEVDTLNANGVQLHFVGERAGLSEPLCTALDQAQRVTSANSKLILNVCFNYGGRWDITQAAEKLIASGAEVTELSMDKAMALAHVADPDLLIRTGAEQRISNFLLWQAAYSELFFSTKLWPQFDEAALDEALAAYGGRERRFGAVLLPPLEKGGRGGFDTVA